MGKILRLFLIASALMLSCSSAFAIVVTVDYSYSGSPGDYLLDFTVTNNIPASYQQAVYFFGVDLANDPLQGNPANWNYWGDAWNNLSYGGSSRSYPSTWITSYDIVSGSSVSGFTVHSSTIPAIIHYYAFADGNVDYYGQDAFSHGTNPGFEGIIGGDETAVPEPATMALLGMGLAGLLFRKKQKVG